MQEVTVLIEGTLGAFYTDYHLSLLRRAFEDANGKDVTIEISSLGGDFEEALKMYSLIKQYRNTKKAKVTAKYLSGKSASAATIFALAADKIIASKLSTFVLHFGLLGVFNYGYYTSEQLQELVKELSKNVREIEKVNDLIVLLYKTKIKSKTEEELRAYLESNEMMTAFEMKDMGFIDEFDADDIDIVNKVLEKNKKIIMENNKSTTTETTTATTVKAENFDMQQIVAAMTNALEPTIKTLGEKMQALEQQFNANEKAIKELQLANSMKSSLASFTASGELPVSGNNGIPPIEKGTVVAGPERFRGEKQLRNILNEVKREKNKPI